VIREIQAQQRLRHHDRHQGRVLKIGGESVHIDESKAPFFRIVPNHSSTFPRRRYRSVSTCVSSNCGQNFEIGEIDASAPILVAL
jgi:hypothetical protein